MEGREVYAFGEGEDKIICKKEALRLRSSYRAEMATMNEALKAVQKSKCLRLRAFSCKTWLRDY